MDYALQMFEQAIQVDGNFALAYAGIANLCGLIYEILEQSPDWISRGLAACDRAMALALELPEVMVKCPCIRIPLIRNVLAKTVLAFERLALRPDALSKLSHRRAVVSNSLVKRSQQLHPSISTAIFGTSVQLSATARLVSRFRVS